MLTTGRTVAGGPATPRSRVLVSAVAVAIACLASQASAACEDPTTTCQQKVDDARQSVIDNSGGGPSDVLEQIKAIGKALKQCWACATDPASNGMDKIQSDGPPQTSVEPATEGESSSPPTQASAEVPTGDEPPAATASPSDPATGAEETTQASTETRTADETASNPAESSSDPGGGAAMQASAEAPSGDETAAQPAQASSEPAADGDAPAQASTESATGAEPAADPAPASADSEPS
ncbi:MAG TPA: hypothetical protein VMT68_09645 [Caulobacteraceae bacterium]|nr:hypothetical protein [Caulobacteraceae bacterium]